MTEGVAVRAHGHGEVTHDLLALASARQHGRHGQRGAVKANLRNLNAARQEFPRIQASVGSASSQHRFRLVKGSEGRFANENASSGIEADAGEGQTQAGVRRERFRCGGARNPAA
jgi:hypothetical protein